MMSEGIKGDEGYELGHYAKQLFKEVGKCLKLLKRGHKNG